MKEKTTQRITGDIGENFTCEYLKKNGYEVICRNFSCYYGEIDIIAQNSTYIAFVEVKTRRKNTAIRPCLSVNKSKQFKIMRTAYIYLRDNKSNLQPRFDIAEVYLENSNNSLYKINYIKNAFVQEDNYANF